jgi:hypothetical protein
MECPRCKRKPRAAAEAEIGNGKIIGSIGILKELVIAGNISPAEAHNAYQQMLAKGAFLPRRITPDYFGG